METRRRGVYGCYVDGELIYVGSSSCKLETLAYNHRNWLTKYGQQGCTHFRYNLTNDPNNQLNEFKWIIAPKMCTLKEIESLEGELIRFYKPKYNLDMNPVGSSIKYGRYQ